MALVLTQRQGSEDDCARILGCGFIRDDSIEKPIELKIAGFEDGIKRMLGSQEANESDEQDESEQEQSALRE